MEIADNKIARQYDAMQKAFDWDNASDAGQLTLMLELKALLNSVPGHTPIYDWGTYDIITGKRSYRYAHEVIDYLNRRIARFERCLQAA